MKKTLKKNIVKKIASL